MTAGILAVASFLFLTFMARGFIHALYRPWLDRRHAAEHAEQRELTTWLAAIRATSRATNEHGSRYPDPGRPRPGRVASAPKSIPTSGDRHAHPS